MPLYALAQHETLPELIASLRLSITAQQAWALPENRLLASRRPGHLLRAGDKVFLPASPAEPHEAQSIRDFVVTLQDKNGNPLANEPYQMLLPNLPPFFATTGPQGEVAHTISVQCKVVTLRIRDQSFQFVLGALGPAHDIQGIQARLQNLGYDPGPVDGLPGPQTVAAIKQFQLDHDLKDDGIMGPKSRATLVKVYGE